MSMLAKISKYRDALMGTAILLIMCYHIAPPLPAKIPVVSAFFAQIKQIGYGAVDLFMFLSGFGLYLSLAKNPDLLTFYKKRLLRLFPAYVPVLAFWLYLYRNTITMETGASALLQKISFAVANLTGAGFWVDRRPYFNWYMAAIVTFYMFTPILFAFLGNWRRELLLLGITLLLDLTFLGNAVMIAISRFTVYVLGMIAGRLFRDGREISWKIEALSYPLGLAGLGALLALLKGNQDLLWGWGLLWYPFILSTPPLLFLLCRFFSLLERVRAGRAFQLFLSWIGAATLEIYLLHIVGREYLPKGRFFAWLYEIQPPMLSWSVVFALMLGGGIVYHCLLEAVRSRCRSKKP